MHSSVQLLAPQDKTVKYAWLLIFVIPVLRRLRQDAHPKLEGSLAYRVRPQKQAKVKNNGGFGEKKYIQ